MNPSKFIKLLSVILCAILLLPILSGCNINGEITTTEEPSDREESTSPEGSAENDSKEETTDNDETAEPVRTEANVIIFSGQSNAYGATPITEEMRAEAAKRDLSNIYIKYTNINLRGTEWKVCHSNDGFEQFALGIGAEGSSQFSSLFGLACYLVDNDYVTEEKPLYIIKYTAAQTVLNGQWLPSNVASTTDPNGLVSDMGGHLADLMNDYIETALHEIEETHIPLIRSFFWIQGESDAQHNAVVSGYGKAEHDLVEGIRQKFSSYATDDGISFVNYAIQQSDGIWGLASTVNNAKKQNAEYFYDADVSLSFNDLVKKDNAQIADSLLVWADKLLISEKEAGESDTDHYHLSSLSHYRLGRIMGRAMLFLEGKTVSDDTAELFGTCAKAASFSEHFISDAAGHRATESCEVCGIKPAASEPHKYEDIIGTYRSEFDVSGHMSDAECSICGYVSKIKTPHTMTETVAEDGSGKLYTYSCTDCDIKTERRIPRSITYFSAAELSDFGGSVSNATAYFNGNAYRMTGQGKLASSVFLQSALDRTPINHERDGINIGQSRYIIIKLRGNAKNITALRLSTAAVNQYTDETQSQKTGIKTYQSGVNLNVTEDWQIFVFDASELLSNVFQMTDGEYVIDTLFLANAKLEKTEYLEVDYIAFTESIEETEILIGSGNTYTLCKDISGKSCEAVTVTE